DLLVRHCRLLLRLPVLTIRRCPVASAGRLSLSSCELGDCKLVAPVPNCGRSRSLDYRCPIGPSCPTGLKGLISITNRTSTSSGQKRQSELLSRGQQWEKQRGNA